MTIPIPVDTTDLRAGAPLHDRLLALLPLVGEWVGEGIGRRRVQRRRVPIWSAVELCP